jgi:hypothetical protein
MRSGGWEKVAEKSSSSRFLEFLLAVINDVFVTRCLN